MKTVEHTPGPWSVAPIREQFGTEYCIQFTTPDGDKGMIVYSMPKGASNCEVGAELTANARLIAAAPDLLEACEALDEWDGSLGEGCEALEDARIAARAAITKAKKGT